MALELGKRFNEALLSFDYLELFIVGLVLDLCLPIFIVIPAMLVGLILLAIGFHGEQVRIWFDIDTDTQVFRARLILFWILLPFVLLVYRWILQRRIERQLELQSK